MDLMYRAHLQKVQQEINDKKTKLSSKHGCNPDSEAIERIRRRSAAPQEMIKRVSNFVPEHTALWNAGEGNWDRLRGLKEEIDDKRAEINYLENDISELKKEYRQLRKAMRTPSTDVHKC
jgi:chromosome segregation ATPase